ncbi:hypothetical protein [Aureivirga sp. CE67]|uniref:hypothetical protein n=1 Tax=Aureivirga sp. CE67 TaxID=1788983 RepID=UPI0018CAA6A1|nr:hypothetical protein [Aureivirga sp. CE67]
MKQILILITTIIFLSCSKNCKNKYNFSNTTENIPEISIDFNESKKEIRQQIETHFSEDLCKKCDKVEFKIPMKFDNKKGFLKVYTDYDYPICENCNIPLRLKNEYSISISSNKSILVNTTISSVDSLSSKIAKYYKNVGNPEGTFPKRFDQVYFNLDWNEGVDKKIILKVLHEISKGHLEFVEEKLMKDKEDFCDKTSIEINSFKEKYPLNIELDLGIKDIMDLKTLERFQK